MLLESTAVIVRLKDVPATWLAIGLIKKWSSGPVMLNALLLPEKLLLVVVIMSSACRVLIVTDSIRTPFENVPVKVGLMLLFVSDRVLVPV